MKDANVATAKASIVRLPPPSGDYILRVDDTSQAPEAPPKAEAIAEHQMRSIGMAEIAAVAVAQEPALDPAAAEESRRRDAYAKAREEGYQEGHAAGTEAGQREWHLKAERLSRIAEGFEKIQADNDARVGEEAVAIAFEVIVKVLGQRQASRLAIAEIVEQTRRASGTVETFVVRVHPEDYEALVAAPILIELEDNRGLVRLVEDPRVAFGGCFVESARGTLDARLETQIERLKALLLDVHRADGSVERGA